MNLTIKIAQFFKKPFFTNERNLFYIWMVVSLLLGLSKTLTGKLHNNYQIYKYVFINTLEQFPLYAHRPEYGDLNHYGPIFSIIMAPFALLPDVLGATLWLVALAALLYFAVMQLPLNSWQKVAVLWICTNSLIVSQTNVQFNIATAAMIMLSYTYIRKEKEPWAAFFIILGTFVKLYGVVGFAFFFFSKNKTKLILWSAIWSILFFVLPMAISSPAYIIDQYIGWYNELVIKNAGNNMAIYQNVSLLGMVRKTTGWVDMSNLPIILGGLFLFALPYLRWKEFKQTRFQLLLLASVLIFVVLFSTGSEPNTYVIAMLGVAIWFVIQPRPYSRYTIFLIIFAILISSFSPSDLFPRSIYKQYILPYAFHALPCTLIWLRIVYEMVVKSSDTYETHTE